MAVRICTKANVWEDMDVICLLCAFQTFKQHKVSNNSKVEGLFLYWRYTLKKMLKFYLQHTIFGILLVISIFIWKLAAQKGSFTKVCAEKCQQKSFMICMACCKSVMVIKRGEGGGQNIEDDPTLTVNINNFR